VAQFEHVTYDCSGVRYFFDETAPPPNNGTGNRATDPLGVPMYFKAINHKRLYYAGGAKTIATPLTQERIDVDGSVTCQPTGATTELLALREVAFEDLSGFL